MGINGKKLIAAFKSAGERKRAIKIAQKNALQKARLEQARKYARLKAKLEYERKYARLKARRQLIPSTVTALEKYAKSRTGKTPVRKRKKKITRRKIKRKRKASRGFEIRMI